MVEKQLIEQLKDLSKTISEISVYDLETYSVIELYYELAKKVNEVITELSRFEGLVSSEIIEQNKQLTYLLNEGVTNDVINKINQMINDGTMETIINDRVLNSLNDKLNNYIKDVNSKLDLKSNVNDVYLKQDGININDFDEETRRTFLEAQGISVNYTLGVDSVKNINILDNSIDFDKSSFFNKSLSINVFDFTKTTDGYIINDTNGLLNANETGCVSDYIRVKQGDLIRFTNNWSGAFFDKDKNFLSGKPYGETVFTVPTNACYYRHSFNIQSKQTSMITINNELPTSYVEYNKNITLTDDFRDSISKSFILKPINANEIDFTTKKPKLNLFNKNTVTQGYIINEKGQLVAHTAGTGCASDFIEVESNKKYYINSTWNGCFYDKNKKFISQKEFGITEFTTPSNTKYVRMSLPYANIDSYMLTSTPITDYKPYDGYLKIKDEYDVKSLASQLSPYIVGQNYTNIKWVALGDSLTEKNNRATKNYIDYIVEDTGITNINMGVSGTGYKRTEESSTAFYQRALNIPNDTDIITIFGSGNDLTLTLGSPTDKTTDTVLGCVNKTIENIIATVPKAKIGIISPTPWVGYPNYTEGNKMHLLNEGLKEICRLNSIPFLDLYNNSNLRPWEEIFRNNFYSRDDGNGVHPDENGHKRIYPRIKSFLESI